MSIISDLFETTDLTPHGFCLSWQPDLMALHVVSDGLIGLSYFAIPGAIGWFLLRRPDLAFRWILWLFVLFILACGSTHFMAIWTIWHPDYGAEGVVKAVAAVASVLTAVELFPLVPKALALPTPSALQIMNDLLRQQIAERDAAVAALESETAERRRAEAMLWQSQKMESIGQLTGGIAHDFNNLLTVVVTNLELLDARLTATPGLRKYVERALKGAARGSMLTQQLLAYARRQPLRPVAFDVDALIAGMSELLRGTLGSTVTLEVVAGSSGRRAEADPHQLENVLLNLVINARDAMPQGGHVRVATALVDLGAVQAASLDSIVPGDYVALSVADTGTGMAPEVRDSAFEPFFTTKPIGKGSGLGLSQVYGFAKQSQGHVTLESEPGAGTTVTIYVRAAPAA
jgi:signal transduction histidine kinase